MVLVRAESDLGRMEIRPCDRSAGNGHFLAAQTVQTILVEVVPTERTGPAASQFRDSKTDQKHCNPFWGAPRIHGELLKLGFEISERTVSRMMPKKDKKPSQTWTTFLRNHVGQQVSVDFFTVATIRLRVFYVFLHNYGEEGFIVSNRTKPAPVMCSPRFSFP